MDKQFSSLQETFTLTQSQITTPSEPVEKKRFNPFFIILGILLIVGLIGVGGYYGYKTKGTSIQKACTTEAKVCPDGTTVGRTGPNCEFAPCPTGTINRVGLWKECDPQTNNCEVGLECVRLGVTDMYRCTKYLLEDDECGTSAAELCGEGLECVDTDKTRQRCATFSTEGAQECIQEPLQICKPSQIGEGTGEEN